MPAALAPKPVHSSAAGLDRQICIWCCRVPEQCPEAVADLVDACTREDPQQRPTMQEVYHILKAAANEPTPYPCAPDTTGSSGSVQMSQILASRNDSAMEAS